MKQVVGAGLLCSAFAPLVFILTLLRLEDLGRVGWVLLAGCVAAAGLLLVVLRSLAQVQVHRVQTAGVKRADESVIGFTSTYLMPIVVALFGPTPATTLWATLALLALMSLIYVRAGLYHLNPTLALLGYRLYEVTEDSGAITMLLTKRHRIPQQGEVEWRHLGEGVAIQLGRTR
ncbi:hypothetical protein [Gephyromycinifex aptenodytis]|uniref:hypothetical protein n=1 Tax=Gephyromycinifex aptenodytis TaxID=2716227 RepID=UPI0014454D50|nr:hypothetical protein [Gephyromycinifex aptenodytis]